MPPPPAAAAASLLLRQVRDLQVGVEADRGKPVSDLVRCRLQDTYERPEKHVQKCRRSAA